jgi:hypothetical protein
MLLFTGIFDLMVEETNWYYHQYLDNLEDVPSPIPEVTDSKMFLFPGIIIQVCHDIRGRIRD